jgi:hypothetical protein
VKPVDQTIFGLPDGNCLAACVASLLHLDITEVPNFCQGQEEGWFGRMLDWLRPLGLAAFWFKGPPTHHLAECPVIVSGVSPRGPWLHAVIWRDGAIVHDPHPSRAGIGDVEDTIVFVPLDPASVIRAR